MCQYEDENIYPRQVCSNYHQIARDKGSSIKKHAVEFMPHSEDGCAICMLHISTKMFKQPTSSHKNLIDSVFTSNGFAKYIDKACLDRCYFKIKKLGDVLSVKLTVLIKPNYTWIVSVGDSLLNTKICTLLTTLPTVINDDTVDIFVNELNSLDICNGNTNFKDLIQDRMDLREIFPDRCGSSVSSAALVESSVGNVKLLKEMCQKPCFPCEGYPIKQQYH